MVPNIPQTYDKIPDTVIQNTRENDARRVSTIDLTYVQQTETQLQQTTTTTALDTALLQPHGAAEAAIHSHTYCHTNMSQSKPQLIAATATEKPQKQ